MSGSLPPCTRCDKRLPRRCSEPLCSRPRHYHAVVDGKDGISSAWDSTEFETWFKARNYAEYVYAKTGYFYMVRGLPCCA